MVISTCFLEKKYGIVILQSSAKFDTGLDRIQIFFFYFIYFKVNPSPATNRMHLKMSSAACKCLHQGL